ncbi:MAG: SGNH/GDSL hydrolase family protein [Polyangiales bacterium]
MRTVGILLLVAAACGDDGAGPGDATSGDAGIDAPPPIIEDVHFYGRWDALHAAGWPGSAIVTRFTGTELRATLREAGDDWLEITVDGTPRTPLHLTNGTQTYTLVTALAAGEHDIEIVKRTESFVGTTRFDGFVGATLVPTARAPKLVEFIGDSNTAGYGALGQNPCGFTNATEAESRAWGAFAAHDLDAAHTAIAYSGIGMYRNCCGGTSTPNMDTMPTKYARQLADQPSPSWDFATVPGIVVIGLGTNDWNGGDPGAGYEEAYQRFITDAIRAHAPGVPILLATSSMMSGTGRTQMRARLDAIAAHFADPTITVVDIAEQQQADGIGCDYHPSEATQRKMATQLVPAIRAATGW